MNHYLNALRTYDKTNKECVKCKKEKPQEEFDEKFKMCKECIIKEKSKENTMNERKLASIQKILNLEPIEGADAIEKATILGWNCVVKKGEFKVGQRCVYFEIDSLIPYEDWSQFLFKNSRTGNHRLKTVKLRGQISQGLALPTTILPFRDTIIYEEGDDVSSVLDVKKYEPEIPASLQGIMKSTFPSWIPKTDETRIQNDPWILEQYAETEVYITEKLDGCSMTVYLKNDEFGVCSRNMDLKESEDNAYWQVARALQLEEKLRGYARNIALQGELIGPGIQGNKYMLIQKEFYVFNVYDIDSGKYFSFEDAVQLVHELKIFFVPGHAPSRKIKELGTLQDLINFSNQSSILVALPREGIVIRSVEDIEIPRFGRFSFKVINPEFLIRYGE